ncbi:aldehyde dehydrogenase [Ceraceosorus bombacis]|uniref:Aldehyde dehydrogenase n=1 Tax=Ceraceosorus bombacis TaxID=401625 RepID=A0A0P1BLL7_9BASI|nr:aldehyde dehydrogenase [Ceraceosorus bombacis]
MAGKATLSFPTGEKSTISTGLFIDNKFVPALDGKTFGVVNPSTGEEIAQVSEASAKDIDVAVKSARKAFKEVWGEKTPASQRGKILMRLADLVEQNNDELARIESLDNGKPFSISSTFDVPSVAANIRYFAGWADKNHGKTIEVDTQSDFHYTRHEPIGVCGQIIPWNFPLLMFAWKIAPALATGNTVVLKTAEQTPLSALKMCELIAEAGVPPGVLNVVSGFGPVAGAAIASHMDIDKVAFTGSTLVGRNIMKAAASSNLKKVTLELGGKSPTIVCDDADLDNAVSWATCGILMNSGQVCCAGSRLFVQDTIYDKFMEKLQEKFTMIKGMTKDGFAKDSFQGPQVSQLQFDRIMEHIETGKKEGATLRQGGNRHGDKGYFIEPTIFENVPVDAKINREEIFGPVLVVNKWKDEEELIARANDTLYGLAAAVHTTHIRKGIEIAHKLQAGTVWINQHNMLNPQVPFGGYKASGIGRELGEYALANYTNVKAVHLALGRQPPI